MENKQLEEARAFYYGFFSKLFTFISTEDRFNGVEEAAKMLHQNALEANSKEALAHFIENFDEKKLVQEFDDIFYDLANDPVPTTASFYNEEIENGKMKVKMIGIVLASKFRKNEEFKDTEDDVGFIFPFMHYLILKKIEGDEKTALLEEKTFDILNTFIDDFIENVYMHTAANLYKDMAVVLKAFIQTERMYLEKPKPTIEKVSKRNDITTVADKEAKLRKQKKQRNKENLVCSLEEGGDVEDEV